MIIIKINYKFIKIILHANHTESFEIIDEVEHLSISLKLCNYKSIISKYYFNLLHAKILYFI